VVQVRGSENAVRVVPGEAPRRRNTGSARALLLGFACACACVRSDHAPRSSVATGPVVGGTDGFVPGDKFEVRIFDEERLGGLYQVQEDGTIDFPLLGTVKVSGLTQRQLAHELERRLGDGYLRDPHVTLVVMERQNREVSVLGQVKEPGSFRYQEKLTLVQALSLAGGLTPLAAPKRLKLTRTTVEGRKTFEVSLPEIVEGRVQDVMLQPGDIVFVPESPI